MPEGESRESSDKDKEMAEKEEVAGAAEGEEEDAGELRERLLRLAAEFDNYKKRTAKQLDGARDVGKAEMMAKLLPTLDEFEIALSAKSTDGEHLKGMEMVYTNLINTLKSCGLSPIVPTGKFDPYKQEIILARKSEKPEGTILEVVRKGYMFNNIMLRPASVIIAKDADDEAGKDNAEETKNKGE